MLRIMNFTRSYQIWKLEINFAKSCAQCFHVWTPVFQDSCVGLKIHENSFSDPFLDLDMTFLRLFQRFKKGFAKVCRYFFACE